jgi:hypothetical protein
MIVVRRQADKTLLKCMRSMRGAGVVAKIIE